MELIYAQSTSCRTVAVTDIKQIPEDSRLPFSCTHESHLKTGDYSVLRQDIGTCMYDRMKENEQFFEKCKSSLIFQLERQTDRQTETKR